MESVTLNVAGIEVETRPVDSILKDSVSVDADDVASAVNVG